MKNASVVAVVAVVGVGLGSVQAQTTLNINTGQRLDEADLTAGQFDGQSFTLGTDLTIEVNNGGLVTDVGDRFRNAPFSFAGSVVNVNEGGQFGQFFSHFSDIELNIFEGGLADNVSIFGGGVINVLGGELKLQRDISGASVTMSSGRLSLAPSGGTQGLTGGPVTVTGGVVGRRFAVDATGVLMLSGGRVDESFQTLLGSTVTLTGGEFQLNGAAITDLDGGLLRNAVFTGTLADGSVFIFGEQAFDDIAASTTTLVSTPLAPVDTTAQVVSSGAGPKSLRAGQTLTLVDGGTLSNHFAVVGATLNIDGGTVGENLEVAYSVVNISGGQIGGRTNLVGDSISFFDGSVVNITGGRFGDKVQPLAGSTVDISGGLFEDGIRVRLGSSVTLHGNDFQLNGTPISDLDGGVPKDGILTGTLADGSVFIFSEQAFETFPTGTTSLASASLGPADTTPMIVSTGPGPQGLRPGQTLTLSGDGSLGDHFAAAGATLNIEGGTVGKLGRIAHGRVNITGGRIGESFSIFDGGTINMTGGEFGFGLTAYAGSEVTISGGSMAGVNARKGGEAFIDGGSVGAASTSEGGTITIRGGSVAGASTFGGGTITIRGGSVAAVSSIFGGTITISGGVIGDDLSVILGGLVNLSGGTVGDDFRVDQQGMANITGGEVGARFTAGFGSTVNISGGGFGPEFTAWPASLVNFSVLELLLDGIAIDLLPDEVFTITDRDGVLLTAVLADGSSFDLTLNDSRVFGQDWVDTNAVLTATLVPEPATLSIFAVGVGLLVRRRGTA